MPAPVTLAFTPYGNDVDKFVARARSDNHEVLLQVPMEPHDYPDNDPGPHTLLSSLSAEQNVDRLHWLFSRMQGYVGITNFMGARFSASENALAPVMREDASGLFGDSEKIEIRCPRCAARHAITREAMEAFVAKAPEKKS